MEPAVPFALLGAVTLLSVAAWASLAVAGVAVRRGRLVPVLLLVGGGLLLAAVDTRTALRSGTPSSDLLAVARAAGLLLLGAGLYAGALARTGFVPRVGSALPARLAADGPAVVVPLAAAPAPAALAAAAGVGAALAALRGCRGPAAGLLATGLLAGAGAAALAPLADGSRAGAVAALGARGASALLLLAGLVALARGSLLAKVVAAIMAGVLAMGAAAVAVVGTTVTRAFEREQEALVRDAADGRLQLLQRVLDRNQALTSVVAGACTREPASCDGVLARLGDSSSSFALLVRQGGTPQVLAGAESLSAAESLGLAASEAVRTAVEPGAAPVGGDGLQARVRLAGGTPGLALVVVAPQDRPTPTAPAPAAFVYGTRVDDALVSEDVGAGGYGLSLLVGGDVVASNELPARRRQVAALVEQAGPALPPTGLTVAAEGRRPTLHLRPLTGLDGEPVATLALTRDPELTLRAQRDALQALLLTALAITALVAGLAVLLGRRTVQPVRRLTAAAERVTAGDLAARAGQAGPDEVGALSRAFDTMTGSLGQVTGDLRASNARLETVLASMADGLVATDAQGRVTSINRAALAMAGVPDEGSALGRRLADVLDVRDPAGTRLSSPAALRQDAAVEVHAADGTVTPVQVAVAPLESPGAESPGAESPGVESPGGESPGAEGSGGRGSRGLVVVLRDTTREREVERMKTEFLSNVSHELRTPLTPIRGYADLLASRSGLAPEQVAAFAGTILAESLKMNRVVDLLVDVAAIEAGRVTTAPRPVPPRELLDARLETWRARAPERSDDLRRRAAATLPPVLVDPVWVGKALDELVDNAVKHTPPGTRITLSAAPTPEGQRVRLTVRDAGPGIAPEQQQTLLVPFAQVDGSATRRVGGLGLGLAFVRRLAEDAGYRLTVTSSVGRGAEFSLDVPAAEVRQRPGAARPSPRASGLTPRRASRAARRPGQAPGQDR